MSVKVSTAVACRNVLGEGSFWDARRGLLWWLDVPLPSRLFSLDPATGMVKSYDMPEMITSVRARKDGTGLIVACHSGISSFDYATGSSPMAGISSWSRAPARSTGLTPT